MIGGREQIREELSKEDISCKCDVSGCESDDINIRDSFFCYPASVEAAGHHLPL